MSRSSHISSSHIKSRASHLTTGDGLDDLGFSRSEASALKIKAFILEAILAEIDRRGFTQQELVDVLDEYQPNVKQPSAWLNQQSEYREAAGLCGPAEDAKQHRTASDLSRHKRWLKRRRA